MKIIAYSYSDPLLEQTPNPAVWGWEVERIYQDLGKREELEQLVCDCQIEPADYLLIRRLDELGDSLQEVGSRIAELEALGVHLIATEQAYNSFAQGQDPPNFRADLLLLLQEIQREQRSRRIRQGHARNRISALPPLEDHPTATAEARINMHLIAVLLQ
jgi:DNA invertase Pin-like site-specific DNA recombinase